MAVEASPGLGKGLDKAENELLEFEELLEALDPDLPKVNVGIMGDLWLEGLLTPEESLRNWRKSLRVLPELLGDDAKDDDDPEDDEDFFREALVIVPGLVVACTKSIMEDDPFLDLNVLENDTLAVAVVVLDDAEDAEEGDMFRTVTVVPLGIPLGALGSFLSSFF